jgi:hypothetical protein
MSEPSGADAPGTPDSGTSPQQKYIDFFLYASAAVTYIGLSIYNKWLLDWIIGPFWLVAWVWGLPAIVKLIRRQPIKPRRGPDRDVA